MTACVRRRNTGRTSRIATLCCLSVLASRVVILFRLYWPGEIRRKWGISYSAPTTELTSADYFGSEDSPKMGHFVVSAAVNVRVEKNTKQPAGRGEYRSDTCIYFEVLGRATM